MKQCKHIWRKDGKKILICEKCFKYKVKGLPGIYLIL